MRCICLFILYLSVAESLDAGISVNVSLIMNSSSSSIYLFEGEMRTVAVSINYFITNQSLANKKLIFKCWSEEPKVGALINWTDIIMSSELFVDKRINLNVTFAAKRLGGSKFFCSVALEENVNTTKVLYQDAVVFLIVKRVPTIAEIVFRFVVMFFVIFLTFVMGCGLERDVIWKYLKRPISPAIGFSCQFLFMPLISLGLSKLTGIENAFGFGLLTIGCSPGGGASNIWTVLFGGDLNLSMTMTFISSCAALFMMPFWLFVLGRFFIDPRFVKIPYQDIGLNLLQVVIPVGFGMLFRWKFESKAILISKKVKIMGLLFVLFILTFGSYANVYIYKLMMDYPYLLPIGASLPWLGFLFGFLMSLATRRSKEQAVAIALETGFQNIGIALLILKFSMPQPGGDLGAVMPIIVALFTPLPLYVGLVTLTIKKRCFDKNNKKDTSKLELEDVLLNQDDAAPKV